MPFVVDFLGGTESGQASFLNEVLKGNPAISCTSIGDRHHPGASCSDLQDPRGALAAVEDIVSLARSVENSGYSDAFP